MRAVVRPFAMCSGVVAGKRPRHDDVLYVLTTRARLLEINIWTLQLRTVRLNCAFSEICVGERVVVLYNRMNGYLVLDRATLRRSHSALVGSQLSGMAVHGRDVLFVTPMCAHVTRDKEESGEVNEIDSRDKPVAPATSTQMSFNDSPVFEWLFKPLQDFNNGTDDLETEQLDQELTSAMNRYIENEEATDSPTPYSSPKNAEQMSRATVKKEPENKSTERLKEFDRLIEEYNIADSSSEKSTTGSEYFMSSAAALEAEEPAFLYKRYRKTHGISDSTSRAHLFKSKSKKRAPRRSSSSNSTSEYREILATTGISNPLPIHEPLDVTYHDARVSLQYRWDRCKYPKTMFFVPNFYEWFQAIHRTQPEPAVPLSYPVYDQIEALLIKPQRPSYKKPVPTQQRERQRRKGGF